MLKKIISKLFLKNIVFVHGGIVVLSDSVNNDKYSAITSSNIDVVNSMLKQGVPERNLSMHALNSYYVDYYLAQVNNGGFSQFVYNSRWRPEILACIANGLREMGATKNIHLFEKCSDLVSELGKDRVDRFFYGKYFGSDNKERDFLNRYDGDFYSLQDEESIGKINAEWLRNHKSLIPLDIEGIREYIWLALNKRAEPTVH